MARAHACVVVLRVCTRGIIRDVIIVAVISPIGVLQIRPLCRLSTTVYLPELLECAHTLPAVLTLRDRGDGTAEHA